MNVSSFKRNSMRFKKNKKDKEEGKGLGNHGVFKTK